MKKALVLVLCLVMLLTAVVGCANTDNTTGGPSTTSGNSNQTTTQGPAAEIVYMYPATAGIPVDLEKVNNAINELSVAKANVQVVLYPVAIANYTQQAMLMVTGQEDLDLFETLPGGPTQFATMVANNQLIDITADMATYAQGTIDAVNEVNPAFMSATTVNGKVYGITALFNKVSNIYVSIRKDVLTKNNLDLTQIKNMNDLEAIVKVLAENESTAVFAPTGADGFTVTTSQQFVDFDNFANTMKTEFFGSSTFLYGGILDDNDKVVNIYESDYYKKSIELAHDWYKKGYVMLDAATQTEQSVTLIANDAALATLSAGERDIAASMNQRTNYEMETVLIANGIVNTGMVQKFVWTVPVTCSDVPAALKFLNLTYTDADLVNLINYGIKDEHYILDAEGRIKYPEGITSQNSPYNVNASFLFGSQYLAKVWSTDEANLRDLIKADNQKATMAKLMGFTFNPSSVSDQIAAVTNVITQYGPGLNTGTSDPAILPEFISALKAAGMDTVIAECQSQVDAFNALG